MDEPIKISLLIKALNYAKSKGAQEITSMYRSPAGGWQIAWNGNDYVTIQRNGKITVTYQQEISEEDKAILAGPYLKWED